MESKYEFFIAGRARNKENILKICDLFDKYKRGILGAIPEPDMLKTLLQVKNE